MTRLTKPVLAVMAAALSAALAGGGFDGGDFDGEDPSHFERALKVGAGSTGAPGETCRPNPSNPIIHFKEYAR